MLRLFETSELSQLAPLLADIGLAAPVAITDIKDGTGRVFRVDLADDTAVIFKAYDHHYKDHYVVSGETYASRLLTTPRLTRFVGVVEILGPLRLILPMLTGILPWLTPLAALGLTIIQVLAIGFHARRRETGKNLPINLVLLALGLFILWGRGPLFGVQSADISFAAP